MHGNLRESINKLSEEKGGCIRIRPGEKTENTIREAKERGDVCVIDSNVIASNGVKSSNSASSFLLELLLKSPSLCPEESDRHDALKDEIAEVDNRDEDAKSDLLVEALKVLSWKPQFILLVLRNEHFRYRHIDRNLKKKLRKGLENNSVLVCFVRSFLMSVFDVFLDRRVLFGVGVSVLSIVLTFAFLWVFFYNWNLLWTDSNLERVSSRTENFGGNSHFRLALTQVFIDRQSYNAVEMTCTFTTPTEESYCGWMIIYRLFNLTSYFSLNASKYQCLTFKVVRSSGAGQLEVKVKDTDQGHREPRVIRPIQNTPEDGWQEVEIPLTDFKKGDEGPNLSSLEVITLATNARLLEGEPKEVKYYIRELKLKISRCGTDP